MAFETTFESAAPQGLKIARPWRINEEGLPPSAWGMHFRWRSIAADNQASRRQSSTSSRWPTSKEDPAPTHIGHQGRFRAVEGDAEHLPRQAQQRENGRLQIKAASGIAYCFEMISSFGLVVRLPETEQGTRPGSPAPVIPMTPALLSPVWTLPGPQIPRTKADTSIP